MNNGITLSEFIIRLSFMAGILMFVIGCCMMMAPELILRTGQRLNRWVSTEQFFNQLDAPKSSERFFYRYHILSGGLLAAASAYIFITFSFGFRRGYVLKVVSSATINEWLTASLVFLCLGFSVLTFFIGLVIMIRPSLLKRLETWSNRWFAVDHSLKRLDVQLKAPDQAFSRRPRLMGFLVTAGSLYILLQLWAMM